MAGTPLKRAEQAQLSRLSEADVQELIYDRIEAGESLTTIAWDLGMRRRFLCDWLEKPEQFPAYARSRIRAATTLAEQTMKIADEAEPNVGDLMKAKLKINSRQWLAKHWDKRTFGESTEQQPVNLAIVHAEIVRRRSRAAITGNRTQATHHALPEPLDAINAVTEPSTTAVETPEQDGQSTGCIE